MRELTLQLNGESMNDLSNWLKERRKDFGFTQMQVADKLGIHQAQVSSLENGKLAPDATLMVKIDTLYGKFTGSYTLAEPTDKKMSSKAKDGLKAYREAKENNFCLRLDANTVITADRMQYILKQGANASYFTEIKSLLKYLVAAQMRQSAVNSVQEIINKIDEIYKRIEKEFDNYDPANIAASTEELYIPDNEE